MGDLVWADNGAYYLTYQTDGNLVVYSAGGALAPNGNFQVPVHVPGCAVMQADGNFVVYSNDSNGTDHCGDPSHAVWSAAQLAPGPVSGAYAVVQGDGNFVIYDLSGAALYQRF